MLKKLGEFVNRLCENQQQYIDVHTASKRNMSFITRTTLIYIYPALLRTENLHTLWHLYPG